MAEGATTDTSKAVEDPALETRQGKRLSGPRDSLKSERNVGTAAVVAALQEDDDDDDDKVCTDAFNVLFLFLFLFLLLYFPQKSGRKHSLSS